jgi:LAO/AO transport system kinase
VGRITHPRGGSAVTIGLTGSPGAGKSTLTNALLGVMRTEANRIGVLAIDPSSPFTGGAILGDRVRMSDHALDDGIFIRSMATRGHLGGLALATPEAIRVLDAAAIPWIVIETVGVGQVEVEVAGEADTTVVVVNPGWGDAVQANKAGLMEVADILVINKADRPGADDTRRDLEQMLELSSARGWVPPIVATVATTGEGVATLWSEVGRHRGDPPC